ncbi:MAG: hypothetical protein KGH76_04625 [Thaumarchaeota archaeon]|nr:hypothetical protein [Nitrososphaerota archaeon]
MSITFFVVNTPQANGMEGLLPKLEPTQHISSNPNLYVSAENSLFKNYFAGPQVIEVIVSDPDINRLDQAYGEPIVTINGKRLRMAQTTDGNWHAYFADMKQAQYADATQTSNSGKGLDFGQFCSSGSAIATGVDFSETEGIAVSRHFSGASNGTQTLGTCTSNNIAGVTNIVGGTLLNHVIKQNTTLNGQAPGGKLGQIASNNIAFSNAWPIIQLYDFSGFPETVTIQYQKAGGVQSVDLVFDRIPGNLIKGLTNRIELPQGAEVQADLLDPQLNIDPTEEDSWTWGTSMTNSTVYYEAFSRNGVADADGTIGMQDISGNLTLLMFNHNGILTTNPRPQGVKVVEAQNNAIQTGFLDSSGRHRTLSISGASGPITLLEIQPNVGIFSDYDTKGIADLKIIDNAMRDTSFLAKYNDISYSIVVKYHTATLTMEIPHGNVQTQNVQTKIINHNPDTVFISFLKLSIVKSLFLYQFFTTLGFNIMMY